MQPWLKLVGAMALVFCSTVAGAQDLPKDDAVPLPKELSVLPSPIAPFVSKDRYEPANFSWMRGRFENASDDEKESYTEVMDWLDQCYAAGNAASTADVLVMGVAGFEARGSMGVPTLCVVVSSQPEIEQYRDYADFAEAVAETRPVFDALVQSVWLAERIGGAKTDKLADILQHRPLGEQMLRNAWSWIWQRDEAVRPWLSERQKPIFSALLNMEMARADMTNTQWLREIVAKNGWPTRSMVGEDASRQAWLIAQHADHAPAFQLEVLRLMEPLVTEKEVSPRDYAYLYDRVMLKLAGKQRYATQMWCYEGKMQPQPLEDAEHLEELRAEMTLEPFSDYRKYFPESC